MGQYERHVFVCTSGDTCPLQGDTEKYVKLLRTGAQQAGLKTEVRINKSGCFSQCGHGPMVVVYPEDVWYGGVQESDLQEILTSHILGGQPVERLRYTPGKPGANKIDVEKKESAPATAAAPTSSWTRVCAAGEVPANGMKQFSVEGTDIVVVDAGEARFAYQAYCPHETIPLEQGVHDGATLTCLEHLWQFDLRTGAPLENAECGLTSYPLKEEQGTIYVEIKRA